MSSVPGGMAVKAQAITLLDVDRLGAASSPEPRDSYHADQDHEEARLPDPRTSRACPREPSAGLWNGCDAER